MNEITNMNKPLHGVKVVDLSVFAAAAAAARLLAEWGADVIKVESLAGDTGRYAGTGLGEPASPEENPSFEANNAYKRGITINLKTPEGLAVMDKLLANCDVFLTNNRTEALVKMGLDYETVHERYPGLVWAQVTGFGAKGAGAGDAGFDPVAFWARSGAMIGISEKDTYPILPPTGFGDRTTACSLAAGICAALYQKQVTGEGQKVEVSLLGQALWNLGEVIQSIQYGDPYPKSRKNAFTPLVNSYQCGDGRWIFISCYDYGRYFPLLCRILGLESLIEDPRFRTVKQAKENGLLLTNLLEGRFSRFTCEEICAKLKADDFPFSRVNEFTDMLEDEQAVANGYVSEYSHRNGNKTKGTTSPVQFPESDTIPYENAPLLGEHTREVLQCLEIPQEQIEKLFAENVVSENKFQK